MAITGIPVTDLSILRGPILVFATLLLIGFQSAEAVEPRRRIYFLESLAPTQMAAMRTIDAFRQRLHEKTTESFELFVDYMELSRFPTQAHIDRTVRYLSEKYAEAPPDLLIALGRAAISVLGKYRDLLAPNAPTIIANVPSRQAAKAGSVDSVYWVATEYNFAKTLNLAQQLQPKARNLVVVGGTSDYDRLWLDDARRELQPYSNRYAISYITDVPYDDLLKQVSQLPKDTIVIMSFVFVDGSGTPRVPPEVAASVAKISSAPVYSPVSSYLGTGIVGGYMDSWEDQGRATADLALEILSGKDPAAIPRLNIPVQTQRIDERQFKRWNINKARLPSEADVRYREFDLWEQYQWQIIAIAAIVLMQAAAITWLFFERRRRQVAETELRQRLLEVIHLNRTAVAGAFSASVAHELGQPLGAIQSNAEAAALYLEADPPNIQRVQQILTNISRDDQRAAEIISHFRVLLKKKDETELQRFDLSEVVHDALEIVVPEALKKGVALSAIHANAPLPVRGDRIHLQQVILNLAINGIDAMHDCDHGSGKMSIETALIDGSSIEVSVADSGMGIPTDRLNRIFDTFYTTKQQGTGLGLPIARTIVETYGGKIWAENRPGGGATFRFTLPLSKAIAA
jgi:signal transduction histidine kinase